MASTIQFKRGTAARFVELNLVLAAGEPGFEYDTKRLKIGDGSTAWNDLPYVGNSNICIVETFAELPDVGDSDCLYKVTHTKTLYQWNTTDGNYESLSVGGSFDPSEIKIINGGNANG